MEAKPPASYGKFVIHPFSWDITWGSPGQAGRRTPGWQGFADDDGTVAQVTGSVAEQPERPLSGSFAGTGPSAVSILSAIPDATEDRWYSMAILEIAAQLGDERAFVQAANQVNWLERPAEDLVGAVHLALSAGAHLFARQLAEHGQHLYPQHEGLSKLAFVLAPPRLVRANLPAEPSTRANVEWMQSHAAEYRGQWVALRDGVFVAAAPTARQLRALLPTVEGLFLTRVV